MLLSVHLILLVVHLCSRVLDFGFDIQDLLDFFSAALLETEALDLLVNARDLSELPDVGPAVGVFVESSPDDHGYVAVNPGR